MLYQITKPPNHQFSSSTTAVLLSGGLDSAVLLAEEAARGDVQPIYVSVGLAWEEAERAAVDALLREMPNASAIRPVAALTVDMTDVYPAAHWAIQGRPPGYHTPDEDVYLPGRNIVLLAKAGVFCAAAGIGRIALGTLDHNPFPDATPAFRAAMELALSAGLNHRVTIAAPFARASKTEVIRRGMALGVPLRLTLSCMQPKMGTGMIPSPVNHPRPHFPVRHCGLCSKCRERHDAFVAAGVDDPTDYADRQFTGV